MHPRFGWNQAAGIAAMMGIALAGCGKRDPAKPNGTGALAATISNRLVTIAAAGDPVTVEALNLWYATPPPGENAAETYARAFAALTKDDPKSAAFLGKNSEALKLLLEAAKFKACRYPLDLREGYSLLLPHLAKIKSAALLLQAEAVHQAGRGQPDAATQALIAGIRLSLSLKNEPLLISYLVEVASLGIAVEGLEQVLSRRALTETQLVELQAAVVEAEAVTPRRVLVGERCFALSYFQMRPEAVTRVLGANPASGVNSNEFATVQAYFNSPKLGQDFDFLVAHFASALARADLPFPQSLDAALTPGIENAKSQQLLLSQLFLPALNGVQKRTALAATKLRLAQAAIAVERFRPKHGGKLPATLSELVPDFTAKVATDPFDGQPLRYQRLPAKGYKLYSIGEDRKDDQGATKSTGSPDVAFEVTR